VIVKTASDATYSNAEFGKRTFLELGYAPFTRFVVGNPAILSSASKEVQAERARILSIRCTSGRVSHETQDQSVLLRIKQISTLLDQVSPNRWNSCQDSCHAQHDQWSSWYAVLFAPSMQVAETSKHLHKTQERRSWSDSRRQKPLLLESPSSLEMEC